MCRKLSKFREVAAVRQQWRCYYCGFPMGGPKSPYDCLLDQCEHLAVTAEHLIARQDGGSNQPSNIAAAHRLCNQRRHFRKTPMGPSDFRSFVVKRLLHGKWFTDEDRARLSPARCKSPC
jgi:hypothetical protein